MWYKEITIETNATKEQIWKLWANVEEWNNWDNQVEFSNLNGEFKKGTSGVLKSINGPKSKFELVSVEKFKEFITRSSLPLSKMDVIHEINSKKGKTYVTHGVKISGLLTFVFSKLIGEKIIKELPNAMKELSKMAENN